MDILHENDGERINFTRGAPAFRVAIIKRNRAFFPGGLAQGARVDGDLRRLVETFGRENGVFQAMRLRLRQARFQLG